MILVLLGSGFLVWVLIQILRYRQLRNWNVAEGFITHYSTETYEEPQVYVQVEMIRPIIQYTYEIDGQRYKGSRLTLEDHSLKSNPESKHYPWPSFAQNESHHVFVDPNNPNNAVLITKMLKYRVNHYTALAIVGIFLFLSGLYISYVLP